ncbi:hypothetical protein QQ020_21860 [Fulvivirgaceae bacterium BMA12]|uniref:Uncharacterized protein n=2 Tax=Agaribacillus aureus TaxID=3051825 RepID=A0ABT8LAG1_9BACT|nr:hypothetical protein [Fulvivirgaceae bacterium BMA12]
MNSFSHYFMLYSIYFNIYCTFNMLLKHINIPQKFFLNTKNYIMPIKQTKADLQEIVSLQLEHLNVMHELLSVLKEENRLLEDVNRKLKEEVVRFRGKVDDRGV